MPIKTVAIAGAGGNLGKPLLAELVKAFEITVITRHSSKTEFSQPNVKVVRVGDNYPYEDLLQAFQGQDAVVSTITTFSVTQQKALINAAVEAGVQRFIPSEYGIFSTDPEIVDAVNVFQEKIAMEKYLVSKESAGLTWTSISNSVWLDWSFKATKGAFIKANLDAKIATILDDGNHQWSTSTLKQCALATRRALERLEATKNKHLFIESCTITQNQLVSALEKQLSITLERETVESKVYLQENIEKSQNGDEEAMWNVLIAVTILSGSYKDKKNYANELLDLPQEDFDEVLKAVLENVDDGLTISRRCEGC